jgi:hypothetical protein
MAWGWKLADNEADNVQMLEVRKQQRLLIGFGLLEQICQTQQSQMDGFNVACREKSRDRMQQMARFLSYRNHVNLSFMHQV